MPPETASAARWRAAFLTVWAIVLIVKVALAATLAPFGDEAWYWQESRALDWSFSDLPVATAALIRCGESVFGHGTFGMRAPFLLIGALLPLVLVRCATRLFGARAGWQAGLLASGLPLLATLGLFALPDAPLTLCAALALDALDRAVRDGRRQDWIVLGLALAGAWLSHYRAAMLLLAGLAFLLLTARGRACWSTSGLWLAVAISICGLLPLLVFNVQHDWVALGFQLVERNPWSFHADGLLQPFEQAIVCTPVFYGLLLWTLGSCLRRANAGPWDLLAATAAVPVIGYFVFGCFADDTRLRLHWPLPGYLPLLLAMPVLLVETSRATLPAWRAIVGGAIALLCAGTLATFGYFALAAVPGGATALASVKAFPEHWVGWNEVAARTRALLDQPEQRDAVLVADNFMLAAELDFAFGRTRPVYTLDHPINAKHGRVPQLRLWQRDEEALRAAGARPLLVVVEPTARRERERAAWLAQVCTRTSAPRLLERLDLYAGRKRYLFLRADGLAEVGAAAGGVASADCVEVAR
jgi:4-amino-4-deoxy-L-arabinose transferase-like glycosyltransferase